VREAQLNQGNREELRKVQSSAALLLERQRNPGVGYWSTRTQQARYSNGSATDSHTSISSPSPADTPARSASPAPSTATSTKVEEEVNLEYIRNNLEPKEMRVGTFSIPRNVSDSRWIAASCQSSLYNSSLHSSRYTETNSQSVRNHLG